MNAYGVKTRDGDVAKKLDLRYRKRRRTKPAKYRCQAKQSAGQEAATITLPAAAVPASATRFRHLSSAGCRSGRTTPPDVKQHAT
jgi:hypothetical protein